VDEDEVLRDRGAPDEVLVGVQFGEDDLGEEALRARGGGVRVGDLAREYGARPSIQTSGWSANGVGRSGGAGTRASGWKIPQCSCPRRNCG